MALHNMAHSFNELCKCLPHDKAVIHEGDSHVYMPTNSTAAKAIMVSCWEPSLSIESFCRCWTYQANNVGLVHDLCICIKISSSSLVSQSQRLSFSFSSTSACGSPSGLPRQEVAKAATQWDMLACLDGRGQK